MSRKTRNRALLGALAVALGASSLGGLFYNPAQARTSFGADRLERAEGFAAELDAYVEAARTCDLDAARVAYQRAESHLNSFELEVQFAANDRWLEFDRIYFSEQVPSSLGLGDEDASGYTCEERVDLAEEQAAVWDSIVEFLASSPEDSPLWNDVHALRSADQNLRLAETLLEGSDDAVPPTPSTEPDLAGAKQRALEFVANDYPAVRDLIAFRDEDLAVELDGLVAAVAAAFAGDPSTGFPTAADALDELSSRFGFAINLVDRAARNWSHTRPTWDPDAWETLDTSADLVLTIFEIRDRIALGTPEAAAEIVTEYNDWLQYPLSRKMENITGTADVDLTEAVNEYAAAQTPETAQELLDELLLAEQVLVGQWWGTPELVQFYEENEEPGVGAASFVATLSPEANMPPGPSGATGSATIEIDAAAGQVCQTITYSGAGAPLSMAHIHVGDATVNGPVVVDLQVLPSGQQACSPADATVLGEIVANPGGYYVNLHTEDFPQGVLRGQLSAA
ncbi:MAG TPA: CHRD domain-containing protein [Acidimicrobiia bacterium]|nr:CHRD domain-containing protein [Acidimicrobiia bacterium]